MMCETKTATRSVTESTLSQLAADEYRETILEHMIRMDRETRPDPAMIDQQPEISWNWWPVLINMMVDMHSKLGLEPQTLFLAVSIVNRYCARRIVYQKHFRLVGVTAMWIASKYEDKKSSVPTLRLLRHMSNDSYSEDMFVMMEGHILNTLDWTVTHCGVDSFLQILRSESSVPPLLLHLSNYIAEITLYHKVFVGKDPLMIAKAINALSMHLLNMSHSYAFGDSEQWQHWVPTLADVILQPPQAVLEKYRAPERHAVTRVVDSWVLRRQRQAQEEALQAQAQAQAQSAADAKAGLRVSILSRQSSTASLPLTPPSAANSPAAHGSGIMAKGNGPLGMLAYSGYHNNPYAGDFTPPTFGGYGDRDSYNSDSPLTMHSLASMTSFGSVTSLNSVNSAIPYGIVESQSPPTTPMSAGLNPPRPAFRV